METFLINLSRGTGLGGLLGIPEQNGKIRRPLLIFSRREIEEYAHEKGILWREDRTNSETKYLRNKIRKNILPLLKDLNGNFEQSFVNTIANLKETFVLSEDASKLHYAEVVTQKRDSLYFDIKKIKKLSLPKAYLYKWFQPYGFTAWKDIEYLLDSGSGKKIYSEDYVLLKNRDELILYSILSEKKEEEKYYLEQNQFLSYPLKLSVETFYDTELALDKSFILVDEDLIKFPLTVRKVKEGDSFKPFGMTGTKKVNKYFKDEKFSQFQKENTWLLCSEDKIIWIIGNRMDDRFKIQDTTTKILKIQTTL
jgi:tRNA(Ile)-lysidine synthase